MSEWVGEVVFLLRDVKYFTAACTHYLTALQWLRNNGCPWDKDQCLELANEYELPSMVAWIQSQSW